MKLLDSNEIRQLRDVCIFEVNGIEVLWAHPTNPVEGCADANPKTELPNDT